LLGEFNYFSSILHERETICTNLIKKLRIEWKFTVYLKISVLLQLQPQRFSIEQIYLRMIIWKGIDFKK
jgi:hypothetical protein